MKIIGYGLGNMFETCKERIIEKFEVIAWCDRDVSKGSKISNFVTLDELLRIKDDDYDKILILPINPVINCAICNELVSRGISKRKIMFLEETNLINSYGNAIPQVNYYGQWNDDSIIKNMIYENNLEIELHNVNYLEIGVYDPIHISNTYSFYSRGGSGVLVDANPNIKNKIDIVRPRDKFINCAIAGNEIYDKKISFYVNREFPELSTINKQKMMQEHHFLEDELDEISVDLVNINNLLKKLDIYPDMVSLDIEGEDEEVIMAWDFDLVKPKIFVIETHNESIIDHMQKNGYMFYAANMGNTFFYLK